MKKVIIMLTAALLCSGTVAQDFIRSEFSIRIDGGVSNFQTLPTVGKDFWNWTGASGLGYHFFFNPHWGLGTGASFAVYNGGISINNYNQRQDAINKISGNKFDFWVSSSNYKEPQQAMMVTIPLMLQYQSVGNTAVYFALGGKAGFPVSANHHSEGNFTTNGYFPHLNVTYEDLPDYGFVTNQPFPGDKTDLQLKTAFMASAELGIKWRLGNTTILYTGVYVDYGLNNLLNKETTANENLVVYHSDTPAQFTYNTATNLYAKQMAPLAGGVTLRLSFGHKKSSPPTSTEEIIPLPPKVDDSADQLAAEEARKQDEEARKQAEEDRLAKEAESRLAAELEARKQDEANRLANEQKNVRPAMEDKTPRGTIENAMYDLEKPVINYLLLQTDPASAQRRELDEKVEILLKYPEIKFRINGHTCSIGTPEVNERVGMGRAEKAKQYLISKGVAADRILGTASKRDTEPLFPNTSEEYRRINRRVQLIVQR